VVIEPAYHMLNVVRRTTALTLFNLRKDLVIKLEPISWAAPPDLKLRYSQMEN
jgi:hypothetical protein